MVSRVVVISAFQTSVPIPNSRIGQNCATPHTAMLCKLQQMSEFTGYIRTLVTEWIGFVQTNDFECHKQNVFAQILFLDKVRTCACDNFAQNYIVHISGRTKYSKVTFFWTMFSLFHQIQTLCFRTFHTFVQLNRATRSVPECTFLWRRVEGWWDDDRVIADRISTSSATTTTARCACHRRRSFLGGRNSSLSSNRSIGRCFLLAGVLPHSGGRLRRHRR